MTIYNESFYHIQIKKIYIFFIIIINIDQFMFGQTEYIN